MQNPPLRLQPFVPSGPLFAKALEFFAELGFETTWEVEDLAGLRSGDACFLLQKIDLPIWQENQMIVFEVANLDHYWAEIEAKDLVGRFPGVRLREPTMFPWGREIHIIDLAGVCWHVRQGS